MLKFGCDPEFFISRISGEDYFVVPPVVFREKLGVKTVERNQRHPVFIKTKNGIKIHEDGVAFEFMVPPQNSINKLVEEVQIGLEILAKFASKFNYVPYNKPTINFDTKEFKGESDLFQNCLIFGCDPDRDAFNFIIEEPIMDVSEHPYRYGGGHIHISGSDLLKQFPIPVTKLLALTVGNYVVSKSPWPDLEKLRTFRYGKPGKFRVQNYSNGETGIEYRTPSNTWCSFKDFAEGIQYWIEKAILKILPNPLLAEEIINDLSDQTIKGILNADQELCTLTLSQLEGI